jgi:hypothetical protein
MLLRLCNVGDKQGVLGLGVWGVDTGGEKVKYLEKNLSQENVSCNKYHVGFPGNEPVPVQ